MYTCLLVYILLPQLACDSVGMAKLDGGAGIVEDYVTISNQMSIKNLYTPITDGGRILGGITEL